MKRVAITAVLLLGLSALVGTTVMAQDTPPPPPPTEGMQMYHIVMMGHGPNWKSQGQKGGMDARIQAMENIKAAAREGLFITAGYWFTSSTSFANPAVTIARSFTESFSGIVPAHAPAFILCQLLGALAATMFVGWLFAGADSRENAA